MNIFLPFDTLFNHPNLSTSQSQIVSGLGPAGYSSILAPSWPSPGRAQGHSPPPRGLRGRPPPRPALRARLRADGGAGRRRFGPLRRGRRARVRPKGWRIGPSCVARTAARRGSDEFGFGRPRRSGGGDWCGARAHGARNAHRVPEERFRRRGWGSIFAVGSNGDI